MTKFQTKSIQLITENDNVSVLDKDKTKWIWMGLRIVRDRRNLMPENMKSSPKHVQFYTCVGVVRNHKVIRRVRLKALPEVKV